MIDFCSMYQNPRTPEQQTMFIQALGCMNCIYGHAWTECIIMNTVPMGVTPYTKRAWPFFERQISICKMDSFGKIFMIDDTFDIDKWKDMPVNDDTFMTLAVSTVSPPLIPMLFDEAVEKMHITNGGDLEI